MQGGRKERADVSTLVKDTVSGPDRAMSWISRDQTQCDGDPETAASGDRGRCNYQSKVE